MYTMLASVLLVASNCEYSPQTICDERNPIKDVSALVALYIAEQKCLGIYINGQKALQQASDVALFLTTDDLLAAQLIDSIGNTMIQYSSANPKNFCEDAFKTLNSYSTEYLRWYGIVE